ncbi:MAG: hypothetical protein ABFS23_01560 [Pseudomonadota bacterium]
MALVLAKQRNAVVGDFGRNPLGLGLFCPPAALQLAYVAKATPRSLRLARKQNSRERNRVGLLEVP